MSRLICFALGHVFGEWHPLDVPGWTTNGDPRVRYCRRCWRFEHNRDARILTTIAWEPR